MVAMTCPFCNPKPPEIVLANDLCYARYDRYPVNPGHLLIIPFRHVADFFDATDEEQEALLALVRRRNATSTRRSVPTATMSA
jgi:diadenosine tetraphosphate (Ap4A) HIT family hydrolase